MEKADKPVTTLERYEDAFGRSCFFPDMCAECDGKGVAYGETCCGCGGQGQVCGSKEVDDER